MQARKHKISVICWTWKNSDFDHLLPPSEQQYQAFNSHLINFMFHLHESDLFLYYCYAWFTCIKTFFAKLKNWRFSPKIGTFGGQFCWKNFLVERQNFYNTFLMGRINHSERASFLARKSVILGHPKVSNCKRWQNHVLLHTSMTIRASISRKF